MKNTSRRIITSVLTLVLTVIALGTTTFAWFSLSTVSNVSNISGDITAGDGLEVRLYSTEAKKTSWKSNLSASDVEDFIEEITVADFQFAPVTATALTTFKTQGTTTGGSNDGNIWLGPEATANTHYLEFEIQFRSQEGGYVNLTDLTFGGTTVTFTPDGDEYIQMAGKDAGNRTVTTRAAYGARVSFDETVFQYGGDEEITTTETTVSGNTFMNGTTGIDAGQWSYLTTSKELKFYSDEAGATQITASSATILKAESSEDLGSGEAARVKIDLDKKTAGDVVTYEGSRTIRIWIEGWDADSYDSIYGAELIVSMIFEKTTIKD